MSNVVPPTERTCERCGRHDVWNDEVGTWTIVEEDGEKQPGDEFCLHEWDITGAHNALAE